MANSETSQAIQKSSDNKALTIRDRIASEDFLSAIKACLPPTMLPETFQRACLNMLVRKPEVKECNPQSVWSALLTIAELGITPDGRRAHLIPFRNNRAGGMDINLIIDYKGLLELINRSGEVKKIYSENIHENDVFEHNLGTITKHTWNAMSPRGKFMGAYAMAIMNSGEQISTIMTNDQIEAVRRKSKTPNAGPWVDFPDEMRKKTCVRRLSKQLPLSAKTQELIAKDEEPIEVEATVTETKVAPKPSFDIEAEVVGSGVPEDDIPMEAPKQTDQPAVEKSETKNETTNQKETMPVETIHQEFQRTFLDKNSITFAQLQAWLVKTNWNKHAGSWGELNDVPSVDIRKMFNAESGIVKSIKDFTDTK